MDAADPVDAMLAPSPDFRYVGLDVDPRRPFGPWLGVMGIGAVAGTALRAGAAAGALVGAGIVAAGVAARAAGWPRMTPQERGVRALAIVPWGVLIEDVDRTRILRWPAVTRVQIETLHGRDEGTSTTRYSVVTVETDRERFVGRAPGGSSLDRLAAHVTAYAREASHRIALDLDGARPGEGPSEPDAELVIASAVAYVDSPAAARLDLSRAGYREAAARAPGHRATEALSMVLRDRTDREVDPRPFAAVLAAELVAKGVSEELIDLVQSPLPLLAAIAKVAATKLGVASARVGTLEEVEPFLLRRDVEALAAWQAA